MFGNQKLRNQRNVPTARAGIGIRKGVVRNEYWSVSRIQFYEMVDGDHKPGIQRKPTQV